jgi:hypothetical protein
MANHQVGSQRREVGATGAAVRSRQLGLSPAALLATCMLVSLGARAFAIGDQQVAQRLVQIRAATYAIGEDAVATVANGVSGGAPSLAGRTIAVVPAIESNGNLIFGVMVNKPANVGANNSRTTDVVGDLWNKGFEQRYASQGIQVEVIQPPKGVDIHAEAEEQVNKFLGESRTPVGVWTSRPHCEERCQQVVLDNEWAPMRAGNAFSAEEGKALNAAVKNEWSLVEAVAVGAKDAEELGALKYLKAGLEASRKWNGVATLAKESAGHLAGPLLALAMGDSYWGAAKAGLYGVPVVGELLTFNDALQFSASVGLAVGKALADPLNAIANSMASLPCSDPTGNNAKPPQNDPSNPCPKKRRRDANSSVAGGGGGASAGNRGDSASEDASGTAPAGSAAPPLSSTPSVGVGPGSNGAGPAPNGNQASGGAEGSENSGGGGSTTPGVPEVAPHDEVASPGETDQPPGAGVASNLPALPGQDSPGANTADGAGPGDSAPPTNSPSPGPNVASNDTNDGLPATELPPLRAPANKPRKPSAPAAGAGVTPASPVATAGGNTPADSTEPTATDPCKDPKSPVRKVSQEDDDYQKKLDAARKAAMGEAQQKLAAAQRAVRAAANATERAQAQQQLDGARAEYAAALEKFAVQHSAMEKAEGERLRQLSTNWSAADEDGFKQCNPEAWDRLEAARTLAKNAKPAKPAAPLTPPPRIAPKKPDNSPPNCSGGGGGIVGALDGINRQIDGCH